MAWFFYDFMAEIHAGNTNLLLITLFSAHHSSRVTSDDRPHPLPAVTIDIYIDTALHRGNHHLTIPPADRRSL